MTCNEYEITIGDYVDGTLPADRAAVLELHLAGCARCRALATDFRVLRSAAASLERKPPPAHVWTRVQAALAHERPDTAGWRRWFTVGASWRPAVAVAVVTAVLIGGTWVAWDQASRPRAPSPAPTATMVGPVAAPVNANLHAPAEVLAEQIAHLEAVMASDGSVLPEETQAIYQASGGAIDDAIGQTRAVLKTEPSNEFAQESLFEALRSKLTLLQDMVALINEMRKGNQEGAARIVSGGEP